ncbi:TlpA family protein disulfide reductase [Desulfitobacterium chlororespirans]|uniref:Peroxiredoxin n=1 Tax=Desulfitobacterium chlororespirans DSM 11544 TaxID=1121395 RepID=A0A1M7TXX0_9FIRM|nr:TlpA disulfide reductase family protein [Desulfitobacterium chlororespirans]SHN75586.1 Peroxiredoxin [Desulfitobacterium chlororespirans DSM 11544]
MNSKTKLIVGIVAFVLFLGIAYTAYSSLSENYNPAQEPVTQGQDKPDTQSGDPAAQEEKKTEAPNFTVYGTDGTEHRLSDFRGKPVVLNFWASWCPPCREEMPHFNEVYAQYKDDVTFLMVDLVDGQRETEESGQAFVDQEGYDFPIYLDKNHQAASVYGVSTIPTTLFIDGEGYIETGYRGPLKKSTLETILKDMLKQ